MEKVTFIELVNNGKIIIPDETIQSWQEIVDTLSEIFNVPVALIIKVNSPSIEVFRANISDNNPFKSNQIYNLAGLYCEKVINSKRKLLIPNALKDKKWDHNPDLEFGMISYIGYPIICPDKSVFGTICLSDTKENNYNKRIEKLMIQYKEMIESHLNLIYQNYFIQLSINEMKNIDYELQIKVKNLEENQILFADREIRIIELQKEVDQLRIKYGMKPKYSFITGK